MMLRCAVWQLVGGVAFTELLQPGGKAGEERMSWAVVRWEGPRRHPGETLRRSGALGEGPALGIEVGFSVDQQRKGSRRRQMKKRVWV